MFLGFEVPGLEAFLENMTTPSGLIHHDHWTSLFTLDNVEDFKKRRKSFLPKNLYLSKSYLGITLIFKFGTMMTLGLFTLLWDPFCEVELGLKSSFIRWFQSILMTYSSKVCWAYGCTHYRDPLHSHT